MCPPCTNEATRATRQAYAVPMTGQYMKMLLAPANPMELQVGTHTSLMCHANVSTLQKI